jgi:hypothetical protein
LQSRMGCPNCSAPGSSGPPGTNASTPVSYQPPRKYSLVRPYLIPSPSLASSVPPVAPLHRWSAWGGHATLMGEIPALAPPGQSPSIVPGEYALRGHGQTPIRGHPGACAQALAKHPPNGCLFPEAYGDRCIITVPRLCSAPDAPDRGEVDDEVVCSGPPSCCVPCSPIARAISQSALARGSRCSNARPEPIFTRGRHDDRRRRYHSGQHLTLPMCCRR